MTLFLIAVSAVAAMHHSDKLAQFIHNVVSAIRAEAVVHVNNKTLKSKAERNGGLEALRHCSNFQEVRILKASL